MPAMVPHNVNTGIYVLEWHIALLKGKNMINVLTDGASILDFKIF